MISKSQGEILRVSASMHALFSLESEELSNTITTNAIDAAIHFVEVRYQQTAYIAGRGDLQQELSMMEQGTTPFIDSNNHKVINQVRHNMVICFLFISGANVEPKVTRNPSGRRLLFDFTRVSTRSICAA